MNKWCFRFLIFTLLLVNVIYWSTVRPSIYNGEDHEISIPHETTIPYEEQDFLYYDEALGSILNKEEKKVIEYTYGNRVEPTVYIDSSNGIKNNTNEVDTSRYEYIGQYNITGYTPGCIHCCGNDAGITASGVEAIAGYTVAADSSIPFGTTLYIEGYGYYVVEDRGAFGNGVIDIAANNHDECYTLTNTGIDVYIVP